MMDKSVSKFINHIEKFLSPAKLKTNNNKDVSHFTALFTWIYPAGKKFRYRGDQTLIKYKAQGLMFDTEIKALIYKFVQLNDKALEVKIFNNLQPINKQLIFHYKIHQGIILDFTKPYIGENYIKNNQTKK